MSHVLHRSIAHRYPVAAGGKGILVRTGYGRSSETSLGRPHRSVDPACIADDLIAATAWILRQE